ncbi:DUF3631 domain-containing protein [Nesterenkonia sp. AY15]|uniref:DUF3631 domain-containing protein n=1 Tax=Nesterenkonia sp. AY15 TaxID=2901139 RepID=UPI001F4CE863|nr:DUF3631 domain-containing protein [Nesterenkonia sp. AY15]MCH8571505.1 DUF3631 domain-containing protein [Nesterenkonia sp. AY15]
MNHSERTLDNVTDYVRRFVSFPGDHYAPVVTLWIAHTYLIAEFDNTGRLAALSAEPASGKSRLTEIVGDLSRNTVASVNASPAAIFRHIEKVEGDTTLIFDEIDTVYSNSSDDKGDLTGLINSGYRRGASVLRTVGENHDSKAFPTFAPVALAGLSRAKLPDALLSRCFIVPMKRRAPGQMVEPYRQRLEKVAINDLRESLEALAEEIRPGIADYFPELPEGVQDRQQDIWEPLVAIADKVGGHWPETAREVCKQLAAESSHSKPSLGTQLLMDAQDIFDRLEVSEISTSSLIDELAEIEESPWGDWYGRPIPARKLAEILKEYEIRTAQFRIPGHPSPIRGFRVRDFQDAFTRYLGAPLGKAVHAVHPLQGPETRGSDVPDRVPHRVSDAGHGTEPGTEQVRKHADVPRVPDVPDSQGGTPRGGDVAQLLALDPVPVTTSEIQVAMGWNLQRAGRAAQALAIAPNWTAQEVSTSG